MLILILLPVAFLLPPGAGAGDSGDPLVCRKTASGIVSWGPPNPPGAYTKVSTFIPWIRAMIIRLESGLCLGEIIGGQEAQPHSRPYMAYLDIKRGNNRSFCGGFLMSKNFVLTAAHCNGDIITVRLGTHNLRNLEHNEQRIPVRRSIPHPRYNNVTNNNDIMLLQLAQQARLSDKVQTMHLPRYGDKVIPGSVCSVAGWGQTSVFPGKTSDVLMEVDLKVMEDRNCSLRFPNKYKPGTMLCAGDPLGRKSSFQGDSGGPLVCGRVAQGIVSFGPIDASPPEVYTRVSQFIPWIKETMGKLQAWDPLEFSLHA